MTPVPLPLIDKTSLMITSDYHAFVFRPSARTPPLCH